MTTDHLDIGPLDPVRMRRAADELFGANCSWCGHQRHPDVCPRSITVRRGKTDTTQPCPCARRDVQGID